MDTTTFFDNFDRLAQAPNGVAKLRELILQMAVSGKLVPQDPSDEPASVLLSRLATERERKSVDVRTADRHLPSIDLPKAPFPIPPEWQWARLGNVAHDLGQKKPDSEFTYIDVGAINKERGIISTDVQVLAAAEAPSRARKIVSVGTVIYATVRPYLLNVAVVDREFAPSPIVSTAFAVFHPYEGIVNRYVYHYLRSGPFITYVEREQTGVAYPAINDGKLYNGLIPIPPSNEQHRIVAKVDELMGLCDELEGRVERQREASQRLSAAALDRLVTAPDPAEFATCWQRICDHFDLLYDAPETLAQLRQTILELAVRGKLVPQDPNDEPIEVTIRTCRGSDGLRSTQCGSAESLSGHFPLPAGWCWGTLKEVADQRLGKMLDQAKNTGHFRPYLRNTNVQWFRFELDDIKEMRFEDEELDEYEVRPGDLLICEGGHGIGRTAVWESQLEQVMFQKALHRVRPFACLNGYFLAFCVRAYEASGVLQRYYTGAGIPHLTGKSLAKVLFPLPPLAEQQRIVAKVDHLMSLCDSLEAKLRQSREDGDRLLAAAVHHLLDQPAVETETCPA